MKEIDWTPHDKFSENTCTCRCGQVFRSHSKYVHDDGLVSRKPCPACGERYLRRAEGDIDTMIIGKKP